MELDDSELLELMDINGFEPNQENLDLLKQGIQEGIVSFLDATDISLEEGSDPDYAWMQILDKNGFEMTEENIDLLKKDCDDGKVMLFTEWWLGDKLHKHKIRKLRRKQMKAYNAKRKADKEAEAEEGKDKTETPVANPDPSGAIPAGLGA